MVSFLQILSVTAFEKVDIFQLVTENTYTNIEYQNHNQLVLFDL